jgi:hypothetical protein
MPSLREAGGAAWAPVADLKAARQKKPSTCWADYCLLAAASASAAAISPAAVNVGIAGSLVANAASSPATGRVEKPPARIRVERQVRQLSDYAIETQLHNLSIRSLRSVRRVVACA